MDTRRDYEKTKRLVDELGWDGLVKHIGKYYPNRGLYAASYDWYDNPKYILKLRGHYGDVIIGWVGHHYY